MKFIKKHRLLFIFLGIILVFVVILLIMLKEFMIGAGNNVYGNRLDGIDKVAVNQEKISTIEEEIVKDDSVNSLKYDLRGRLISIIIEVKDGITMDKVKEVGNKIIGYFDDEEKTYYDIQLFVKCDNIENTEFPVIAYKHKTSEALVWE